MVNSLTYLAKLIQSSLETEKKTPEENQYSNLPFFGGQDQLKSYIFVVL